MTETYKVRVYINKSEQKFRRFPGGYQNNDPLVQALEFDCESTNVDLVLDTTFQALNQDNAPGFGTLTSGDLLRYHVTFPSLSVGDVVEVNGYKFACESVGWREIGVREMVCLLCHRRTLTGDEMDVCADCRQGDPWEALAQLEGRDI